MSKLIPTAADLPPFFGTVPDFVLADWRRAQPHPFKDRAGKRRRGRPPMSPGLFWAIHLAVVFQGCSRVVVPDVLLRQVLWGGSGWPQNWRQTVLRLLRDKSRPLGRLLRSATLLDSAAVCPPQCVLHGSERGHRHLSVEIVFPDELKPDEVGRDGLTTDPDLEYFLGCLEIFGWGGEGGYGDRSYVWQLLPLGPEPDEQDDEWTDYETEKLRQKRVKGCRKAGLLMAAYFPMVLFGRSPRLGLTYSQVQLHKALTRETTRCTARLRSERPDRAEILRLPAQGRAQRNTSALPEGLLEPGSYVGFNGNGTGRKRKYHGRGYRLPTWMDRARYLTPQDPQEAHPEGESQGHLSPRFWEAAAEFLADLARLSEVFGLVAAGWNPDRRQWLSLAEMRDLLGTKAGCRLLLRIRLRVYTEEDYLARWRQEFVTRMGFAAIPSGEE